MESITLYKLMILYMLSQVKFPLTNTRLTEFFVSKGYTSYFIVQQAIAELIDSRLLLVETIHNTSRYEITKEGEEVLSLFKTNISTEILTDIDAFLLENKFQIKNEIGTSATYHRSLDGEYVVTCEVLEGKNPLISISLAAPDEAQAEIMANNWKSKSEDIYQHVMRLLLGGK